MYGRFSGNVKMRVTTIFIQKKQLASAKNNAINLAKFHIENIFVLKEQYRPHSWKKSSWHLLK